MAKKRKAETAQEWDWAAETKTVTVSPERVPATIEELRAACWNVLAGAAERSAASDPGAERMWLVDCETVWIDGRASWGEGQ